ncbi:hypothetical protein B1A99_34325 [Cohnella sp. CIP 111063]|jgi:hypothetical protein|uniref:hypothetical protein n=1 Tax=unclassified Cohnella TaxID=2636738 RepID=UPI000B8C49C3|nr:MULTISPECIES: hypothetical protein [unclassified Cohnella]OXS52353.1 hypothetical protein B1A99_34325 [Cohnella sp. CIP 111063]PRX57991.1 hypothetical protein B0G52_13716 [Cohnella sp. SGD-V74]
MNDLAQMEWLLWLGLGMLLLAQSTGLFLHARSRGRKAWFWGLWGLTNFPSPLVTYALLQAWNARKRKRQTKSAENHSEGEMRDG